MIDTAEGLQREVDRLGSFAAVARAHGVPVTTIKSRAARLGVASGHARAESTPAGVVAGDGDTITSTLPEHPKRESARTERDVLADHGYDVEAFELVTVTDNYWQGNDGDGPATLTQSKATIRPRQLPADHVVRIDNDWTPDPPRRRKPTALPVIVPIFSDPHFPLHEPALYEASLAFLDEHAASVREVIVNGDEGDWTPFGRHRTNRRVNITVAEAIGGVYKGLAGWRAAAPDAPIKLLPGNHSHWLQARLLEMFPAAVGIRRPGDDHDLLSLRSVCRLDELHIDYLDTPGEYHDVHYQIADGLIVMHGTRTGKHGGATKEIEVWEGASVMQGHDHSGALTVVNYRLADGGYAQRYAVSCLAMARRDLGYSPKRDVAQGFPVVTIHPSGQWHIDLALYDPQTRATTWRDWIYRSAG